MKNLWKERVSQPKSTRGVISPKKKHQTLNFVAFGAAILDIRLFSKYTKMILSKTTFFLTLQDYGIWERGDKLNHGLPELNASSIGMAKVRHLKFIHRHTNNISRFLKAFKPQAWTSSKQRSGGCLARVIDIKRNIFYYYGYYYYYYSRKHHLSAAWLSKR